MKLWTLYGINHNLGTDREVLALELYTDDDGDEDQVWDRLFKNKGMLKDIMNPYGFTPTRLKMSYVDGIQEIKHD